MRDKQQKRVSLTSLGRAQDQRKIKNEITIAYQWTLGT